MKKLLILLLRQGVRQGSRRGVLGGNRAWLAIGGVALLGHLGRKALGREVEVVFSEPLKPGESFRVTHLPRP